MYARLHVAVQEGARTLLKGFVRVIDYEETKMPMATNICTVVLEVILHVVHVEDVTAFSSFEDEYFHLFEER